MSKADQRQASVVDRTALLERVAHDPGLLCELFRLFREQRSRRMSEIREALRTGDARALSAAAHALKGAIGNFSIQGAFDTAECLQHVPSGDMEGAPRLCDRLERELFELECGLEALVQKADEDSH